MQFEMLVNLRSNQIVDNTRDRDTAVTPAPTLQLDSITQAIRHKLARPWAPSSFLFTLDQARRWFGRWLEHYRGRHEEKDKSADARAATLWRNETVCSLSANSSRLVRCARPFDRRLWEIGQAVIEVYQSRRSTPLAASWAADSET